MKVDIYVDVDGRRFKVVFKEGQWHSIAERKVHQAGTLYECVYDAPRLHSSSHVLPVREGSLYKRVHEAALAKFQERYK